MPDAFRTAAYVGLGAAALGLVALNVLAWSGRLIDESPRTSAPRKEPNPASEPIPPPAPEPQPVTRPQRTRAIAPAAISLTISATRGDCWVEVRAGSATGALLYAGTLASGESIRFNRKKLWLRLGAAANVDVLVNGRPSTVPSGTVELLLPG